MTSGRNCTDEINVSSFVRSVKSNKHLSFSSQARKLILTGLNLASSAVSATMNPKAETL
ncbi:MAG: hypothetical protein ACTS80_00670 [Candidatus Hodgkinia cicadicola]